MAATNDEQPLSVTEQRQFNALLLYHEAHDNAQLAEKLRQPMAPSFQRLFITQYHCWLEHPEEFDHIMRQAKRFRWVGFVVNWTRSTIERLRGAR